MQVFMFICLHLNVCRTHKNMPSQFGVWEGVEITTIYILYNSFCYIILYRLVYYFDFYGKLKDF